MAVKATRVYDFLAWLFLFARHIIVTLFAFARAIHAGNLTFNDGLKVEKYLLDDIMQSVKPWIETIIEKNYK